MAPAPAIAGGGGGAEPVHTLEVMIRPLPNGRMVVDVTVLAPDGQLVVSSKATTTAGVPVKISTTRESRVYDVTVSPSANGSGMAELAVREGSRSVQHAIVPVKPLEERTARSNQEPITMQLTGANLHDVLQTFGSLTGKRVVVDPNIQGTVSVYVTDVPWDVALARAIAPLGLRAEWNENEIRVVAAKIKGAKRIDKSMKPPQVLSRVEPQYTDEARAAKISGVVIVEIEIDETGVVRNATVLKDLPHGLGQAATDAVKRWVFAPALVDGKAVPVIFTITVNFKLDEDKE
jgi:protein TonB